MKQYIDSQEHWEDSVNASHEHQKEMEREHQRQIEKQASKQPTEEESFISSNIPVNSSADSEDSCDDETEFIRCSECDGHDACEDFGCAFDLGLGRMVKRDPTAW